MYVQITPGDITLDYSINLASIVNKITDFIKLYAKSNYYNKTDF